MPNAVWPVTLPQTLLLDGFQLAMPEDYAATPMDVGPGKRRLRDVAYTYPVQGSMHLTRDQVATFRTFYLDTIARGALPFDWTDPLTGTAETYLFKKGSPPTITPVGGYFLLAMNLERQP